ncbi:MAG: hypothetical protein AB7V32_08545 [Candidatus Berkiella sp.]
MLDSLYVKMSAEQKAQINDLIAKLNSEEEIKELAKFERLAQRIAYIRVTMLNELKVDISDKQIEIILNAQNKTIQEIEAAVLKLHKEPLRPDVKLALQTGLCIAALYYVPELLVMHTGKELVKKVVATNVGPNAANLVEPLMIGAGYYYDIPQLNSISLLNSNLPECAQVSLWRKIPALIIANSLLKNASEPLQKLAALPFDKELNETAGDFFDVMYGHADQQTLDKYKGSLATMPIDEALEGAFNGICRGVTWLWQHAPSISSSTVAAEPTVQTKNKKYPN